MPFKKVLTQAHKEQLIRLVNDHANAQAAAAAIIAVGVDHTPESVRNVVQKAAVDALNALNVFVDGITEPEPVEPVPLEDGVGGYPLEGNVAGHHTLDGNALP